ncbi:MAG: class I SAM-dependent methyltransferase [Flavobacteriales bacterium]|nr:class I SAM-dependent methyltransferase [Flavobacteriales bacterium]
MVHTPIAIRVFDAYAQRYAERFMDVSAYHTSLDRFCALLPQGAELLELACGPGNVTKFLLHQRPDLRILGTDLAPGMVELARTLVPAATFELLDQRTIATTKRRFHGIVCAFGLPYLDAQEAADLIRDAAQALHPGGALYLSTMEDDPARSGFVMPSSGKGEAAWIQYHRGDDLVRELERNGFNVVLRSNVITAASDGSPANDLMLVAQR